MKGRSTGGVFEKSRNCRDHPIALDISLGHPPDTCGDEAKEVDPKVSAAVWELSCGFVVSNNCHRYVPNRTASDVEGSSSTQSGAGQVLPQC